MASVLVDRVKTNWEALPIGETQGLFKLNKKQKMMRDFRFLLLESGESFDSNTLNAHGRLGTYMVGATRCGLQKSINVPAEGATTYPSHRRKRCHPYLNSIMEYAPHATLLTGLRNGRLFNHLQRNIIVCRE